METVDLSTLFQGTSNRELQKQFIGSEHSFAPHTENLGGAFVKKAGVLLSREANPSFWSWVQNTQGSQLVSDVEWLALQDSTSDGAVSAYSTGDGSTTFRVPTVGLGGFARAKGTTETDPVLLNIGFQDQIQNITGGFDQIINGTTYLNMDKGNLSGAFSSKNSVPNTNGDILSQIEQGNRTLFFDASLSVRTGEETHPKGQYVSVYIYTGADTSELAPSTTFESLLKGLNSRNILYNTGHSLEYLPENQRNFNGDWSSLSVGEYGYDGWLCYDNLHKAQIIELGGFENKTYTLSYDGVSVKTISPVNMTEPWLIKVPNSVDKISLTPSEGFGFWQPEDIEVRKSNCYSRYYDVSGIYQLASGDSSNINRVSFKVSMTKLPVITQTTQSGTGGTWVCDNNLMAKQSGTHSGFSTTQVLIFDSTLSIADAGENISG